MYVVADQLEHGFSSASESGLGYGHGGFFQRNS